MTDRSKYRVDSRKIMDLLEDAMEEDNKIGFR